MTTSNPTVTRRTDTPDTIAAESRPTRVRRGDETKPFYKTTEFVVFVVATVAVLLASYLVKTSGAHEDYFRADQAWLYVVVLSVGYMVSRGLAKSGSRHRDGS
ncbi:hypothetical protein A5662_22575 [Mycobacteriaceae bacterium 1482268.1]|nr:hypothetical protein A5662_22575 [Mycobacteriaceae bacterium 1482268.1]